MKLIKLLELDDTMEPSDLCRTLAFMREFPQSDYIPQTSRFGGPINRLNWLPVSVVFGKCWYGKKIREYLSQKASWPYEFVRVEDPAVRRDMLAEANDRYAALTVGSV
jgi:hypothetical protein